MNIATIRALILAANLLLLGLIGYAVYEFFYDVDPAEWEVKEPKWERYQLPDLDDKDRIKDQQAYKIIHAAFDPPPPPPAPVVKPPAADEIPKADLSRMQILMVSVADGRPEMNQVCLTGPLVDKVDGAPAQRFFGAGIDLGEHDTLGFKAYKGSKVKSITEDEVIFTDPKGKEVHVPCPKQTASKGKS